MRRLVPLVALGILSAAVAQAQPPGFGRPQSPPVSPYLNLLNRSNSTAFNYYQLYRPQTEFRESYQGINRDLYRAQREVSRQQQAIERRLESVEQRVRPGATLGTTGHPTSFMNQGDYFRAGVTGR